MAGRSSRSAQPLVEHCRAMAIIVPSLAYLPQLIDSMDVMIGLLDRGLDPARRFRRVRDDQENDLRLAVVVHALNALDEGRTIRLLAREERGNGVYPHCRTVFEALVKIRWMRKSPPRATAYLDSEPFERYMLASPRVKKSDKWPKIIQECKNTIAQNPKLLDLPKAVKKDNMQDFAAIARGLRMPSMRKMTLAVGLDDDDYMLDFGVSSLSPHTSITHIKNFAKGLNADKSARLSTDSNPNLLLGYVARATMRVSQTLGEVLELYPDGAIQFDAENAVATLNDLVVKLGTVIP